jgi:hypothetical protein
MAAVVRDAAAEIADQVVLTVRPCHGSSLLACPSACERPRPPQPRSRERLGSFGLRRCVDSGPQLAAATARSAAATVKKIVLLVGIFISPPPLRCFQSPHTKGYGVRTLTCVIRSTGRSLRAAVFLIASGFGAS